MVILNDTAIYTNRRSLEYAKKQDSSGVKGSRKYMSQVFWNFSDILFHSTMNVQRMENYDPHMQVSWKMTSPAGSEIYRIAIATQPNVSKDFLAYPNKTLYPCVCVCGGGTITWRLPDLLFLLSYLGHILQLSFCCRVKTPFHKSNHINPVIHLN